jgi:hypothetical protein
MKVLPLEFQKLDPLTEWWYLVPHVDDDHCIQANPMATVIVHIKRKPGYYVKLGIGMLGMLTTLGFTSHSLELDKAEDRINNVVAIVFTVLSLRFSLAEGMATVNYMTSMDVYMAVCMLLLILLAFAHALVAGMTSRMSGAYCTVPDDAAGTCVSDLINMDVVAKADVGIFFLMLAAWIVFNVWYALDHTVWAEHAAFLEEDPGFVKVGHLYTWFARPFSSLFFFFPTVTCLLRVVMRGVLEHTA